jgi:hypothetical protein
MGDLENQFVVAKGFCMLDVQLLFELLDACLAILIVLIQHTDQKSLGGRTPLDILVR